MDELIVKKFSKINCFNASIYISAWCTPVFTEFIMQVVAVMF